MKALDEYFLMVVVDVFAIFTFNFNWKTWAYLFSKVTQCKLLIMLNRVLKWWCHPKNIFPPEILGSYQLFGPTYLKKKKIKKKPACKNSLQSIKLRYGLLKLNFFSILNSLIQCWFLWFSTSTKYERLVWDWVKCLTSQQCYWFEILDTVYCDNSFSTMKDLDLNSPNLS